MSDPTRVPAPQDQALDPVTVLKALTGLRQLTTLYPVGHPVVEQALVRLEELVGALLRDAPAFQIDVIFGDAHLNGEPFRLESRQHAAVIREFLELGIDSVHVSRGVTRDELRQVATVLSTVKEGLDQPLAPALGRLGVTHLTLGRLVELDTRSMSQQWPDAPVGPLEPDYAESLERAADVFAGFSAGRHPSSQALRELLHLLMFKVANSTAALGHILAVKQYENHTYCHSVNVSILSLLLARRIGVDEVEQAVLVEAALLHDVGKTKVPVEILRKPGGLDQRERRVIERHAAQGAMMLLGGRGLHPLTPTVALEHHRHATGGGYPDLGNARPHALSRIVSVADVYEAVTGARSYRVPALPEEACLVLARAAGRQLDAALVKAFVSAVTFFPVGTLVRTTAGEVGVVVRVNDQDPLHPVIRLAGAGDEAGDAAELDLSQRDALGAHVRHVAQTLRPSRDGETPQAGVAA